MARRQAPLSAELRAACKQFDGWRAGRSGRSRVPQDLWDVAVELAQQHGVSRVATVLGVSYEGLKRRSRAAEPSSGKKTATPFVELPLTPGQARANEGAVVELRDPSGSQLTIRSSAPVDVVALTRAFLAEAER